MKQLQPDGFDEFVAARWSALFHFARLLSGGDRHRAEDLLQEALVKLWFAWPKVAQQAPEPYVRQVLTRAAARSARRRWWGERPTRTQDMPEITGLVDLAAEVEERSRLEIGLAQLPVRQRAAVVLRYYQDLPERQVAEVLGCPVGTARSLVSRGVAKLRQVLAEAVVEPVR
ncbi:SigE family RNA polymerase sigma factor [Kitasatospora mediocidica]|uniref:SigE family RNA polymerase sigma factor n=1 Tax=Kitasatospora mediocidica TaxID=58352 RepID=UPI000559F345|nr:SigE family RNA polymerase sigma factor [Kitasatospora mediocidica]